MKEEERGTLFRTRFEKLAIQLYRLPVNPEREYDSLERVSFQEISRGIPQIVDLCNPIALLPDLRYPGYSRFPSRYTAESPTHRSSKISVLAPRDAASHRVATKKISGSRKREKRDEPPQSFSLLSFHILISSCSSHSFSRLFAPFSFLFPQSMSSCLLHRLYTFIRPTLFSSYQLPPAVAAAVP